MQIQSKIKQIIMIIVARAIHNGQGHTTGGLLHGPAF